MPQLYRLFSNEIDAVQNQDTVNVINGTLEFLINLIVCEISLTKLRQNKTDVKGLLDTWVFVTLVVLLAELHCTAVKSVISLTRSVKIIRTIYRLTQQSSVCIQRTWHIRM